MAKNEILDSSAQPNFSIYSHIQLYYLDIQAISTLLCLLLVLYILILSIHSFFYLTTALLKRDVFRHSKAYFSHSFQPTGIGLALCEEETGAYYQLSLITSKLIHFFFLLFLKFLPPKYTQFSKNSIKFIINFFSSKIDNWAYVYIY